MTPADPPEIAPRSQAERERLIVKLMPQAKALAREFRGRGLDDGDLEGEAYAAAVEAVDGYDVEAHPDASLANFAGRRIRWRLKAALEKASVYRMPRSLERAAAKCRAAKSALMADGNVRPTLTEIAERAGLDEETALETLRTTALPADWIDQVGLLPAAADSRAELAEVVEGGLALCSELGRRLLELCGEYDLTVGQAARRLGIPLRQARSEHRLACATLAAHARGCGFDESRYAAAIA